MIAPTMKATPDTSARSGATATPATPPLPLESAILGTYKRAPIELVRGSGVYLYDAEGTSYLDFGSGIAVNSLGYDDPGLKAALHAAAEGLIHTSNLYHTAPGERRYERACHRDTRRRPVLRNGSLRQVDVQVALLHCFQVYS